MILFLTRLELLIFCRLSSGPLTGSVCGLVFSLWTNGSLWILGATVWRRLLGISSAEVDGGPLVEFLLHDA